MARSFRKHSQRRFSLDYEEVIARFEDREASNINLGLKVTETLLARLGNPHQHLTGALVAGTNGKGSVCATLQSIARAAGNTTTLLVKPHLVSWTERIVQNGLPVTTDRFTQLANDVLFAAKSMPDDMCPTGFEILTAMGFLQAAQVNSDVLMCEVGLGGRLDSTNVVDLGLDVITNISLDHTDLLGDTIEEIAAEKAGIIKSGNIVVTGASEPALSVITGRARELGADLHGVAEGRDYVDSTEDGSRVRIWMELGNDGQVELTTPLIGGFQGANLATAAKAAHAMGFSPQAIQQGAATVSWPGRMQWISDQPSILVDGAHNPAAMEALSEAIVGVTGNRHLVVIFGAMRNKLLGPMLETLSQITSDVVFTQLEMDRAAPPSELVQTFGGGIVCPDLSHALEIAKDRAGAEGVVVVCGSLALVGAAISVVSDQPSHVWDYTPAAS